MPKRTRTKDLDPIQNARRVVLESMDSQEAAAPSLVSQIMASMGARGGRIGGKRRLETMTPEQRSKSAKKAAKARWSKAKKS